MWIPKGAALIRGNTVFHKKVREKDLEYFFCKYFCHLFFDNRTKKIIIKIYINSKKLMYKKHLSVHTISKDY